MARPIPRKLLIHKAVHRYGVKVKDEWENETWSESRELKNIRIEPTSKVVKTKDNVELQLALLLFFDTRNSIPTGGAFDKVGSLDNQIIWEGVPYTIKWVEPIFDEARLHHYEVGLV